MPRNPSPRQPRGPTLSPEQARIKLQRCIDKGKELSQKQPFSEEGYRVWHTNTFTSLQQVFGEESGHLYTFTEQQRIPTRWNPQRSESQSDLLREITILKAL